LFGLILYNVLFSSTVTSASYYLPNTSFKPSRYISPPSVCVNAIIKYQTTEAPQSTFIVFLFSNISSTTMKNLFDALKPSGYFMYHQV